MGIHRSSGGTHKLAPQVRAPKRVMGEELVKRWAENVLWQFFSGMEYYEPRWPCDSTQIGHFLRLLGKEGLKQLFKARIECALDIQAVKPTDLQRVIVDTTVQSKAIAQPVDSGLLEIARHKLWLRPNVQASRANRPMPKKVKSFAAGLVAMPTPNSSSGCAKPSNVNAPSPGW